MGGLAGLIHFRGQSPDLSVVERVSQALAHRGPAAEGTWAEGKAVLAHRLRRIGAKRSAQPLVRDDVVVLLDGWIYDHEALARLADHQGSVSTDVEALVAGWRAWGPEVVDRIEGEFAFAIWDRKESVLHLYRDRLGVRPLFWARRGGKFAFASELPALLQVPWVSREIAREHLSEYLSFQVVHAPRTLLEDVRQVEPAHHLRVSASGETSRRWWTPKYAPVGTPRPTDREVVDQVEAAVVRAVRRRVPRGVDTGLYLSGGLGSTAIAAAARQRFLQLPSFTVSFTDDLYPELPFAGRVAGLLGLEHHKVEVGTIDLARRFDEAVATLGHPVGHPGVVLQQSLADATAKVVPVALSGDGAEEIFGGRMLDRLGQGLLLARALRRLPGAIRSPLSRIMGVRDADRRPVDWVVEQGVGGHKLFEPEDRGRLLRDHGLVRPELRHELLSGFYAGMDTDAVNASLYGSLRSWVTESDLVRADRTAARAGLDLRFPLLDREVLETAAALPGAAKLRRAGGMGRSIHTRWPLRAMLQGTLPSALLDRPKRGLPKPLDNWLAGPGRLFMEERYARLRSDSRGLWRPDGLEQLRRDLATREGAGIRLWTMFILDQWLHGLETL